jgi:hypothetical protein
MTWMKANDLLMDSEFFDRICHIKKGGGGVLNGSGDRGLSG